MSLVFQDANTQSPVGEELGTQRGTYSDRQRSRFMVIITSLDFGLDIHGRQMAGKLLEIRDRGFAADDKELPTGWNAITIQRLWMGTDD